MACSVRRVDYFTTTVTDRPGEAYKLLTTLANLGISLLAFTAVPIGPLHTHLTLFPGDTGKLAREAQKAPLVLDGPHPALLVCVFRGRKASDSRHVGPWFPTLSVQFAVVQAVVTFLALPPSVPPPPVRAPPVR